MMKMAVKAVAPYLSKITEGLDAMAKEYGVQKCILMIMERQIPHPQTGVLEPKAVIVFMGQGADGMLIPCQDKEGKSAEYPVEKLIDLIAGGKIEDDEE